MLHEPGSGRRQDGAPGRAGSGTRVTESRNPFADAGFRGAMQEMAALGLRVTEQPQVDSTPFGVLAGAGSRWFLLPLRPRAACHAALAMVQPLRRAPRALKRVSGWALGAGLAPALLRHRVHVAGSNRLAAVFGSDAVHCAFLTGTAGPHRKLVAQCMRHDGDILGYAKVACSPAVHALLTNEAAALQTLRDAGLRSAQVPRVLRHEVRAGTALLVTGTVPGTRGARPFHLQAMHLAFLDELATCTSAIDGGALLDLWQAQVHGIAGRLSTAWRVRFASTLRALAARAALVAPRGWAHGDFTPVNCFPDGDRLFVFDWEYAGGAYPADFDLIRFLDTATRARRQRDPDVAAAILHELTHAPGRSEDEARARLMAYACACALRGALRQPLAGSAPLWWTGERNDAALLDTLRADARRGGASADWRRSPPATRAAPRQHRSGAA